MTGSLVFSVDAELAWGLHDLHPLTEKEHQRCRQARARWLTLLELFETYDIPATWAIVGHLLTDDEQYREQHPLSETWFETAVSGIENQPDQWLARDLIEAVQTSPVEHELGSHSFSHVIFSDVSPDIAEAECRLAREVGRNHEIDFTSFVFPRNEIAHREVLAESGFQCYRGTQPNEFLSIPGFRGLGLLAGSVLGRVAPPTVTPSVDEFGLVTIPASVFMGGFRGQPWTGLASLNGDPAVKLIRRGIDRASENGEMFHLWLHPHDLTNSRYIDRVRKILSYVSMKRRQGEIRIETMGDVAERHVEGGPVVHPQSTPSRVEPTVSEL